MIITNKGRVIVYGDIHGDYELAILLLKKSKLINDNLDWIGGDTQLIQIGDLIDECRLPGRCGMVEIQNSSKTDLSLIFLFIDLNIKAQKSGGGVNILLGNHEILNIYGIFDYVTPRSNIEFLEFYKNPIKYEFINDEDINIIKNFYDENKEKENVSILCRGHAFKPGNWLSKLMAKYFIPSLVLGKWLFIHGSLTNEYIEIGIKKFNKIIINWLNGEYDKEQEVLIRKYTMSPEVSPFWNRDMGKELKCDNIFLKQIGKLSFNLNNMNLNGVMVGHTPQYFIGNGLNSICSNRIFRTDVGMSRGFNIVDKKYRQTKIRDENRIPSFVEINNNNDIKIKKITSVNLDKINNI